MIASQQPYCTFDVPSVHVSWEAEVQVGFVQLAWNQVCVDLQADPWPDRMAKPFVYDVAVGV